MKIEVKDLSPVRKTLEVEVPPEDVESELERLVRGYARSVKVPGFRKGHVPADLVRKRFGKEIEEEAKERLIGQFHAKAVEAQGLRPLNDPVVEEVHYHAGEPLRFRTVFEVTPPIRLGTTRGLELSKKSLDVAEAEVDRMLEAIRESVGRFVPVEPVRPAERGDHLVVDVSGRTLDADAREFHQESVLIDIGAEETLREFRDALLGSQPGDEKTFEVSYPADGTGSLAGRRVEYRIVVRELKRRELAPLDDALAKEVGEPNGLAALRERVRKDLAETKERRAQRDLREEALKLLIESHGGFDLPEVLVEQQLRRQMEDAVRLMLARGMDPSKIEMDWKALRDSELETARKRVRGMLILEEIARTEGLVATPADTEARVEREARETGVRAEELRKRLDSDRSRQALKDQVLREKALDFVVDQATIRE